MVRALRWLTVTTVLVAVLGVAGSGSLAQERRKHSGTVVAVDAAAGTITLAEVGPWRVRDGETVITYRTITVTPETEFTIVGPPYELDAPPEAFVEESIEHGAIYVDDFVTVDCLDIGGDRMIAVKVAVTEVRAGVTLEDEQD